VEPPTTTISDSVPPDGPRQIAAGPLLEATGLCLSYGRKEILRDVNFQIGEGEFWFFLGPNGQGKTTLLRSILGMLKPRFGSLWRSPSLVGYERIGFVPQRCDLNPTLPTTVREFVLMGLVGIACNRAERLDRLSWSLEKVGLSDKQNDDYWSLSGGQRQRALVARALVRRPRLLVLDEPTNGLDLPTEASLLGFLASLNEREKLTMVFVTHDLALAARHASHFALFHDATVSAGPAATMLHAGMLARTYGLRVDIGRTADGIATVHLGAAEAPA
jgi:ABC-type Mn2+/Zn2+ transport system ATPase subunit